MSTSIELHKASVAIIQRTWALLFADLCGGLQINRDILINL